MAEANNSRKRDPLANASPEVRELLRQDYADLGPSRRDGKGAADRPNDRTGEGGDRAQVVPLSDSDESEPPPEAPAPAWPDSLDTAAYHGLAGNIVRTIEPASEADPAALLVQTLVAFGNAIGRGP